VDLITTMHGRQLQATRAIVDGREAKVREQMAMAYAIGRISPFTSYSRIVTALAWTGPEFEAHLLGAMREYEDRLLSITRQGMKEEQTYGVERIPYFQYSPPPVARRFMMAFMDWVLLASGTVVFFLGAYVSFVKREID